MGRAGAAAWGRGYAASIDDARRTGASAALPLLRGANADPHHRGPGPTRGYQARLHRLRPRDDPQLPTRQPAAHHGDGLERSGMSKAGRAHSQRRTGSAGATQVTSELNGRRRAKPVALPQGHNAPRGGSLRLRRKPLPGPFLSSCRRLRRPSQVERGNFFSLRQFRVARGQTSRERHMNGLIYLIGLIVVILAILSFFGLR